jgi:phosphatidylinositol 4-kinase B
VKSGDDLRLEEFAMQLISLMDQIFKRSNLKLWLYPYEILATGHDCGIIEFVNDGLSIDYIHHKMSRIFNRNCTLFDYFRKNFGMPNQTAFKTAQRKFAESLAAYSLVCYIL